MTTTRFSRFAFAPLALLPLLMPGQARADSSGVFFDEDTGEELVRVANCPANSHHAHGMRCLSSRLVTKSYAEAHKIGPFTAPPDAGAGVDASADITACNGNAGGGGTGGGSPKGLGPTQYNKAYNIPSGSLAPGKVVAIVDACAETTVVADLAAYRKAFGLPDLPQCGGKDGVAPTPGGTPCFGVVSQRGDGNLPPADDGWAGEIALDVDMVSIGCPECSILLVEADSPNSWDLGPAVDEAVTLGAAAVSNSYGSIEDPKDPYGTAFSDGPYVKSYQHPGVLIAVASGDSSYDNQNWQAPYPGNLPAYLAPGFPSTIPEVLSVGGTNLKTSTASSRGYAETVWGGSTSGCSTEFAKPGYQNGIDAGSCAMRADVDVTAPGSGVSVYQGGWQNGVGGTSCASPFVAALLTHVGLAGQPNDFFYAHPEAFFDLGTGAGTNDTTGNCTDVMCNAGPGWDGPSGLGSPNAQLLAELADGGVITPPADAGPDATVSNDGGSSDGGGTPAVDGSSGPNPLEDAGQGGNNNNGSGSSKGCGCVTAGASSSPAVPGGAGLVALGAVLARRRRKRG